LGQDEEYGGCGASGEGGSSALGYQFPRVHNDSGDVRRVAGRGRAKLNGNNSMPKPFKGMNLGRYGKLLGEIELVNDSFRDEMDRNTFKWLVHEALRRGGTQKHLETLRWQFLAYRRQQGSLTKNPSSPELRRFTVGLDLRSAAQELDVQWVEHVLWSEETEFSALIAEEFAAISPAIVKSLKPKEKPGAEKISDAADYRYRIRPIYYSNGYEKPAAFLSKMRSIKFLNNPKAETFVHEILAEKLERVPAILEEWSIGASAAVAAEIKSVNDDRHGALGVQMRNIGGTDRLSNHAFGLAIDIDVYSNPNIKGKDDVVPVMNSVVREGGSSFDFGANPLPKNSGSRYTKEEVKAIHQAATKASEIIMTWLRLNLPRYRAAREDMESAEKVLDNSVAVSKKAHIPKFSSQTSLAKRRAAALRFLSEYTYEINSQGTNPGLVSGPMPEDDPVVTAYKGLLDKYENIQSDKDLSRIQILYENYDLIYINTWIQKGVLTVPVQLATALVVGLGLRWGETYGDRKDAMHFELTAPDGGNYFTPEHPLAKGEKPRTLENLMKMPEAMFGRPVRVGW
jgi:hypothetical protein